MCHFKLVLLGDTAVGKSCLVVRFVRDEFFEFQEPTIGGAHLPWFLFIIFFFSAAFLTQSVALESATVKFEIWDTAGQGDTFDTYFIGIPNIPRTLSKPCANVLSRGCSCNRSL